MKSPRLWLAFAGTTFACYACASLERDIVVPLPPHETQLVVECYLERGKPYRLALTESVTYVAPPLVPIVRDATVRIGSTPITYRPIIDSVNRKGYNYTSDALVANAPDNAPLSLEITDPRGRRVTGQARFLPLVRIKEAKVEFNDRTKASVLVRFNDDTLTTDYYRLVIIKGDSLRGTVETNISFRDRFGTRGEVSIGTGFNFKDKDTLNIRLFHIDQPYYEFLQSAGRARSANGNPFGQPSQVTSTVAGGIGVFATLVYDRQRLVLKKEK